MDDKLNILIAHYKEEVERLSQMKQEDLREGDYLMASKSGKALNYTKHKLEILMNIDDKLYMQKNFEERRIEYLESMIDKVSPDELEDLQSKLDIVKEKLNDLNAVKKPVEDPNGKIIENTLILLLNKEISSFRLFMNKEHKQFFDFKYSKNTLSLSISKKSEEEWEFQTMALEKLGFVTKGNKLIVKVKGTKEEVILNVKTLVAIIFFEIFSNWVFYKESYIEIPD